LPASEKVRFAMASKICQIEESRYEPLSLFICGILMNSYRFGLLLTASACEFLQATYLSDSCPGDSIGKSALIQRVVAVDLPLCGRKTQSYFAHKQSCSYFCVKSH